MILELVVGLPIKCTKNNFGPKEVANGTLSHLIDFQTKVSLFLLNKFPLSLPLFSQLTNAKDKPF
jgi:hypothetical protein